MFPCYSFKRLVVWIVMTIAIGSFTIVRAANAAPPAPTVVAQGQAPITVAAGEYMLVGLSPILAPGEYVGQHSHTGPDLVLVFEGEVIEKEPGGDRPVKAGESWINQAGEQHAVNNEGDAVARLWGTLLLPKNDKSITPSARLPLTVEAGEYSLIGRVLDFAPGSGLPEQSPGGDVLYYVLDGEITLLENGTSNQVKAFKSWTEVPNAIYSVTNTSGKNARVAMSMLLPEGAEEITVVNTPTPPPAQDVSKVSSPTLPATQDVPNSSSQFSLVLIGLALLLIIIVSGFYLRRRTKG